MWPGESGRRPEADAQLQPALALYRSVGATAHIREAESLFRSGRLTRIGPVDVPVPANGHDPPAVVRDECEARDGALAARVVAVEQIDGEGQVRLDHFLRLGEFLGRRVPEGALPEPEVSRGYV